jgi:hypothetical protein
VPTLTLPRRLLLLSLAAELRRRAADVDRHADYTDPGVAVFLAADADGLRLLALKLETAAAEEAVD